MKIEFWENKSGRSQVFEFIERQPNEAAGRIMKTIDHLARQGTELLSSSKMKTLTGYRHLYELRVDFKGTFYRIIFCISENVAHLLVAFAKKGNHTPERYVTTALTRQRLLSNSLIK